MFTFVAPVMQIKVPSPQPVDAEELRNRVVIKLLLPSVRIVLFITLLSLAPYSSASSKVALLVGVSDYNERNDYHSLVGLEKLKPLRAILEERGFSVAILMNPTSRVFERKLGEFAEEQADLALLFISARGRDQTATEGPGFFGRIFLKDATWKLAGEKSGHYSDDELRREYGAKHVWILIHGCNCEKIRQGGGERTTRNVTPCVADIIDQTSSLGAGTLTRSDGDNDGSALAASLASVLKETEELCGDKLFDRLKEDVEDRVDSLFRFSRGMADGACI